MDVRRQFDLFLLQAVRAYTRSSPIDKGKYRLILAVMKAVRNYPDPKLISVEDGRKFWVDLSTGMHLLVYFMGRYEKPVTQIASVLLRPGDTCIDAGANFGWYTTLMAAKCGPSGSVHAFEPFPSTFKELGRNVELSPGKKIITINNAAVGDHSTTIMINLFEGAPTGHASLANEAGVGRSFDCRMITLDEYLSTNHIEHVDFVKVDIEGAELIFLKGAESIFRQSELPVIMMEMALEQSRKFGYCPNDLLSFISERGDYVYYRVDEEKGKMFEFKAFTKGDVGANVFCIPKGRAIDALRQFIG